MADKLPPGWVRVLLSDVTSPVSTIAPEEQPKSEFTYLDIGSVDNIVNAITAPKSFLGEDAPSRARQEVQTNDILFSTVRTNLRNIARIEDDYVKPVASTGFAVVRPGEGISSEFLFFQLLSDHFVNEVSRLQTGSSYPAVRAKDVFGQLISLPPVQEQQRIVQKLKPALEAIQNARSATLRAKQKLTNYRAQLIASAVIGGVPVTDQSSASSAATGVQVLTEITRLRQSRDSAQEDLDLGSSGKPVASGMPDLPIGWAWSTLEMVADIGSGVTVSRNRVLRDPIEVPYLRVANVLRGRLDISEMKTIEIERASLDRYRLQAGDVLFNEGGDRDKLGRGWIWEDQIANCVHQNHVFRARLIAPDLLEPRFVSHWGNTHGQSYFLEHATQTTNLASINRATIGRLPIPVPPVAQQKRIVQYIEERLSAADRLDAKLDTQLEKAIEMRRTLLEDAMSGRLVEQLASDEDASMLVARLQASKAQSPNRRRAKMKRKPATPKGRRSLLEIMQEYGRPLSPEELFRLSGHTQETIDDFFAELRTLTGSPARIEQERKRSGSVRLKVVS